MKRWVVAVLFSIVASCPALSNAAEDLFSSGRATRFTLPVLKIPFGSAPEANVAKKKEDAPKMSQEEKDARRKEEEKAKTDKKIDDAIDKAWGRELPDREITPGH